MQLLDPDRWRALCGIQREDTFDDNVMNMTKRMEGVTIMHFVPTQFGASTS
jgi:hypothetical protein